jgi:hypothetical protein
MASACVLSPYGKYETASQCDTTEKCKWLWKCVNGVPELAPDGTYATAEECKCWDCTVDGCVENTSGAGGFNTQSECESKCVTGFQCTVDGPELVVDGPMENPDDCKYVCDGEGNRRVRNESDVELGKRFDDLLCYNCVSSDSPSAVGDGEVGEVSDDTLCKYTCEPYLTPKTGIEESKRVYDANGVLWDDAYCYLCSGDNEDPSDPIPVEGVGVGNTHFTVPCRYACDGNGGKMYVKSGGTSEGYDTFKCSTCEGGSNYTYVEEGGINGDVGGDDGIGCRYWCDESGNAVAVSDEDKETHNMIADVEERGRLTASTADEVKCVTCNGLPGPDSSCGLVEGEMLGQYKTLDECDASAESQCGWGYGCGGDDTCVISSSAQRGVTEHECKMDSTVQCGWGYGCYTKYACVDGSMCASVPDDQCGSNGDGLVCHDSMDACISNSACSSGAVAPTPLSCNTSPLDGSWYLYDEPLNDQSFFTFVEGVEDEDGFVWYNANVDANDGSLRPLVEIGLSEVVTNMGGRTISMKFRGVMNSGEFWSTDGVGGGSYESPFGFPIANLDANNTECFVLDSVDLGSICGQSQNCATLSTLILQREDFCGGEFWMGSSGDASNGGRLNPSECPGACSLQFNGNFKSYWSKTGTMDALELDSLKYSKTKTENGIRLYLTEVENFDVNYEFIVGSGGVEIIASRTDLVSGESQTVTYDFSGAELVYHSRNLAKAIICVPEGQSLRQTSDDGSYIEFYV